LLVAEFRIALGRLGSESCETTHAGELATQHMKTPDQRAKRSCMDSWTTT
jgi:hypothetical protein